MNNQMKHAHSEISETTVAKRLRGGGGGGELDKLWNTADIPVVYLGNNQSQALRMATFSDPDEPIGTASIASCLSLLIGLVSDNALKAKLLSFLGFTNAKQLLSLNDPCRVVGALLSPLAKTVLEDSPNGPLCKDFWSALGVECVPLKENLEAQINEMLKKCWETDKDIFKPGQLVPADEVEDLIAALVSMEKIKVSWNEELDIYHRRDFTTSTGEKVPAQFCTDKETRNMDNLYFDGGNAVLLPCKPDEVTGKERGMIFVLPKEDNQDLDKCLESLAQHSDTNNGLVFGNSTKYNFSFPAFNAIKDPATIKPWLSKCIPEIFEPESFSMEGTLPAELVGGPAYIGDVQHGASIQADRKGAEAKAVTVATVMVYRSIGAPPEQFICNRPFISILATLKPGTTEVENVEFVTKHTTSKTLDLTVV